jgi:hypothetical protein
MLNTTDSSILSAQHAAALVTAARAIQPEARSFAEDPNEGYLLLHAALRDALRRRAVADPHELARSLRAYARDVLGPSADEAPVELV